MTAPPSPPDRPAVLVVEDEALVALHVKMVLEEAGFDVCGVVADAARALSVAEATRPEAAVVDVRLGPGPDGIHVAERLVLAHGCRVVFVSGSGERETLERARGVAGSTFLQKPLDPDALVASLREVLG